MTHPTNVQIPDPYLAYGIREALDLEEGEPIPESKLQELTELYTEGPSHAPRYLDDEEKGITDLTGLEKATGLVQLYLSDHSLMNDLRPLAGLQNLQSLDLSDTSAEDVTPLSGLQNLRSLDLRGTRVEDVTPLSGLQNLRSLDLTGTSVSDVTPFANLQNLQ